MTFTEIRNVVLLFSNVWYGATVPKTVIRNITALSSQLAYEESIDQNLTTLTMTNSETLNGVVRGLLYVPTIAPGHPCEELERQYLPPTVARQSNLPPGRLKLIALAPWFNISCTQAYFEAARDDPVRAFVVYRPNDSPDRPQDVDSPVWDLDDDGAWRKENPFPIFAVPGTVGAEMMRELGRYSGDVADVPHGQTISQLYKTNARDYVRIFTELTVENPSDLPTMWVYLLCVVVALVFIILGVCLLVGAMRWNRRRKLQRRVEAGDVNLEALGIKGVTVPREHVLSFPLYVYVDVGRRLDEGRLRERGRLGGGGGGGGSAEPHSRPRSRSQSSAGLTLTTATDLDPPNRPVVRQTTASRRPQIGPAVAATNHQPDCHLCMYPFVEFETVVRQLPCGHIYHPDCIDELLGTISSLCPLCGLCLLPLGYSPKISNAMVQRERAIRQLRPRVRLEQLDTDDEDGGFEDEEKSGIRAWGGRVRWFGFRGRRGPGAWGGVGRTAESIEPTPEKIEPVVENSERTSEHIEMTPIPPTTGSPDSPNSAQSAGDGVGGDFEGTGRDASLRSRTRGARTLGHSVRGLFHHRRP